MNDILVKIIMPAELLFEANATLVNIPSSKGVIGILPGHMKLVSTIDAGLITVFANDEEKKFFIYGGIAQVSPLEVNIISEFVVSLDEQKKADILDNIANLKLELTTVEKNSLDASILDATIIKYNSLLKFCE